jgi:hypothetical protein
MIIKHQETKNQNYTNIKLKGLSVICSLNGFANAGSQHVDFTKSVIQVILTRNGSPHVITSQNLKVLGLASTLGTLNQSAFCTDAPLAEVLVAGQSGMVSFEIPFGGVVDLHGTDNIYIEVVNSSGLFTNPALEATSFLEIKPLKCYGIEQFIPRIRAQVIQANEASNQYMFGDNCIRLAVLNYDKTDFKNNVINNIVFGSDRLDETYNYPNLIARKISAFGKQLIPLAANDLATSMQEDQSFLLVDFNEEYDAVTLDINFRSENVAASSNYIVSWNYDTDWTIIAAANAKKNDHDAVTRKKLDAATLKK